MKTSSQLISFLRATTLALCFIPFSQHAQAESEPLLRGVASSSGVALTPIGGGAATAARGDHTTVEGIGGYVPPPSASAAAGHVAVDVAAAGGAGGGAVAVAAAGGAGAHTGYGPDVDALLAEVSTDGVDAAYQTLIDGIYHVYEAEFLKEFFNSAEGARFLEAFRVAAAVDGFAPGAFLASADIVDLFTAFSQRHFATEHGVVSSESAYETYIHNLREKTEGLQKAVRFFDAEVKNSKGFIEGMQAAHTDELQRLQRELEATRAAARAPVASTVEAAARATDEAAERIAPQIQSGNRYINFIKTWGGWCVAIGLSGALTWLKLSGRIN